MPLKHPQSLYTIIPLILQKNSHSFCAASIKTYIPVLSSFISSSPLLRFVPSLRAFNFDVDDYLQVWYFFIYFMISVQISDYFGFICSGCNLKIFFSHNQLHIRVLQCVFMSKTCSCLSLLYHSMYYTSKLNLNTNMQ